MGISVGALIMRVDSDSSGQMSIDFLIGITIFILAFMYVVASVPQMFTPFQSNSDELTMMADRVAANLVEKTLAYNIVLTDTTLPSIVDIHTFDTVYKTNINQLYTEIGVDKQKYCIEVDFEELNPATGQIYVADSVTDTSHPMGNQNVGQSRRYVLIRDSSAADTGWPGTNAVLVVRIWQWKS